MPRPIGFDPRALRAFLNTCAEVAEVRVVALTTDGAPLTRDEALFDCPLCIARVRRGVSPCKRRTQEAARAAARGRIAHVYACHDGARAGARVSGLAVPLFGENGVVATVCLGPFLLQPLARGNEHARDLAKLPVISDLKLNDLAQLLTGAGHFALRQSHPFRPQAAEMRLVIDLVRGNVRDEREARARMAYLGPPFTPALIFVADIDDFARHMRGVPEGESQLLKEKVVCAIRTAVGEGLSALISGDSIVVILGVTSVECQVSRKDDRPSLDTRHSTLVTRHAMELAEKARRAVRAQTPVTVTIGVGRPHLGALQVHKSFLEAQSAVYHKRLLGKDRVISIAGVEPQAAPTTATPMQHTQELLTALRSGDRAEVARCLVRLLDEQRRQGADEVVHLKHFALQLVTRAAEVAVQRGLSVRVTANLPFEFARAMEDRSRSDDIRRELADHILSLTDTIAGLNARWSQDRMEISLRYLQAHFASPLTLGKVAREAAHLSAPHFSRAFKRATGESFVQCLNRLRLERAQELLRNSTLTINDISAAVGYSSQHYFSKVFRRFVGVAPNEFRRVKTK